LLCHPVHPTSCFYLKLSLPVHVSPRNVRSLLTVSSSQTPNTPVLPPDPRSGCARRAGCGTQGACRVGAMLSQVRKSGPVVPKVGGRTHVPHLGDPLLSILVGLRQSVLVRELLRT
jgi:hypothetical protein